MKRSEMVLILQKRFDDYDLFDPSTIGEDILSFVEAAGMVPPSIRCGGYHSDENGYANEWEDEDDH